MGTVAEVTSSPDLSSGTSPHEAPVATPPDAVPVSSQRSARSGGTARHRRVRASPWRRLALPVGVVGVAGLSDCVALGAAQRRVRRHLLALGHGQLDARPPPGDEPRHLLVHRPRPLLDHARMGLRRPPGRVGAPHRPGGLLAPVGRSGLAHRHRGGHALPAGRGRVDLDRSAVRGGRGGRHALPRRPAPDGELLLPGPAPADADRWPGAAGVGCIAVPVLFVLWANLHGSFPLGLGILAPGGLRRPGAGGRPVGSRCPIPWPSPSSSRWWSRRWPPWSTPSGPVSTRAPWG